MPDEKSPARTQTGPGANTGQAAETFGEAGQTSTNAANSGSESNAHKKNPGIRGTDEAVIWLNGPMQDVKWSRKDYNKMTEAQLVKACKVKWNVFIASNFTVKPKNSFEEYFLIELRNFAAIRLGATMVATVVDVPPSDGTMNTFHKGGNKMSPMNRNDPSTFIWGEDTVESCASDGGPEGPATPALFSREPVTMNQSRYPVLVKWKDKNIVARRVKSRELIQEIEEEELNAAIDKHITNVMEDMIKERQKYSTADAIATEEQD